MRVRSVPALALLLLAAPAALLAQQPSAPAKPDSAHRPMTHDTTKAKAGATSGQMDHMHMEGMNHGDPDRMAAGGGALPMGWRARTDRDAPVAGDQVKAVGDVLQIVTGPAVVLWRPLQRADGPFHAMATFTQTKAPRHPEGYGLVFGGDSLEAAGQHYTYFLVRGDGKYLIKRRTGEATSNVTPDWTAHPAIHTADAQGRATNAIEIDAKSRPDSVRFLVNQQEVYVAPASGFDLRGVVGLRVNHNLDLEVSNFALHSGAPPKAAKAAKPAKSAK